MSAQFLRYFVVVLFALHTEVALASGGNQCTEVLIGKAQIERAIHDLSSLRISIDIGKVHRSKSLMFTALSGDFDKKEKELIEYLERHKIMTRAELLEKMREEIRLIQSGRQQQNEEESRRRQEQEEQIRNSVIDGTRAVFHPIEPGSFKMGEVYKPVDVTLTKPFEMMATPVTQIIWKKIAELVKSRFGNKYKINVDPSQFKGATHPVETVSYEDIEIWIKGLNELSQIGEPSLSDLISGHKQGDVYRLPTEAEWEFVVRGRGEFNDVYHFGNDVSQLGDYAWFRGNSAGQNHPVAEKRPLVINGREFYDMHGSVWEWVHDWYADKLPGGTDPQGPPSGASRVLRGGSWGNSASNLRSANRYYDGPGYRCVDVGFRLVRTAK